MLATQKQTIPIHGGIVPMSECSITAKWHGAVNLAAINAGRGYRYCHYIIPCLIRSNHDKLKHRRELAAK